MRKIYILSFLILITMPINAQQINFKVDLKKQEITNVEKIPYLEGKYEDGTIVLSKKSINLDRTYPEFVLIWMLTEMNNLAFNEWFKAWDAPSKIMLEETGYIKNKDLILKSWQKNQNVQIKLLRKALVQDFVIIEYGYFYKSGEVTKMQLVFVRNENGQWFATNQKSNNPVLQGWKNLDRTVRNYK